MATAATISAPANTSEFTLSENRAAAIAAIQPPWHQIDVFAEIVDRNGYKHRRVPAGIAKGECGG